MPGLKGDNYRMTKKKKTLCEVPADTVEGAVLTAPSQVDYSIIEDSLHRGIPLLRISPQGRFLGHLDQKPIRISSNRKNNSLF